MKASGGTIFLLVVLAVVAALLLYKTQSSPILPRSTAEFGGAMLQIEYALTPQARETGLSGRKRVPEGYGMLFVFPKDGRHGFWMKEMFAPIDIFWLDAKGHVVSISPDIATTTYPNVFYPSQPARYVLETAAGFSRANRIIIGTRLLLKNFPNVSE